VTTEAGMMRCPNCGGDVRESARTCGYCLAELATVRCHRCFALNATRSAHCSGCGRELGLEPVGDADARSCPSCQKALVSFRGTGGDLLDCSGCGGQFVEHELLRSLFEAREVTGLAVPRRVRRASLEFAKVRYVPCPGCKQLMNRKNFGGESGVVVDVCSKHGTWFEEGELPQVLAFVESGGLARARARQRDREQEQNRAARVQAALASSRAPLGSPVVENPDLEDLADATLELIDWLGSHFQKRK
jgi:Zn-finger nucleic acid-binding protein